MESQFWRKKTVATDMERISSPGAPRWAKFNRFTRIILKLFIQSRSMGFLKTNKQTYEQSMKGSGPAPATFRCSPGLGQLRWAVGSQGSPGAKILENVPRRWSWHRPLRVFGPWRPGHRLVALPGDHALFGLGRLGLLPVRQAQDPPPTGDTVVQVVFPPRALPRLQRLFGFMGMLLPVQALRGKVRPLGADRLGSGKNDPSPLLKSQFGTMLRHAVDRPFHPEGILGASPGC